jgi:uncharacterized membrane protein
MGLCEEFIFSIGCPAWVMLLLVLWILTAVAIFTRKNIISEAVRLMLVSVIILSFILQKANQAIYKKDPCLGY